MCSATPSEGGPTQASQLPAGVLQKCFEVLEPRDLCRASAVCRLWRELSCGDARSNAAWQAFYGQNWAAPPLQRPHDAGDAAQPQLPLRWQAAYGMKMAQARSWQGKPRQDKLFGHTAAVRCLALNVRSNLLFTGSIDRTVRAWDLQSGVQLAVSRQHKGTVRSLVADDSLLVSGSSDHHIRAWVLGGEGAGRVSLAQRAVLPGGHAGPVTALELTPAALFSGSWDYSIRVWDRRRLECTAVLHVDDFVSSLAARADQLLVGCGSEVLLYSLAAGGGWQLARAAVRSGHGPVTAVQGSLDGRYLFLGTGEGAVVGVDLRCGGVAAQQGQRLLLHDPSGVSGLSWEYPYLGVSLARGQVALLEAEAAMGQAAPWTASGARGKAAAACSRVTARSGHPDTRWVRWLGADGGRGEAATCMALGDQWVAAGQDSGIVMTWDFSHALEQERAAAALRQRKQRRRQARASGGGGGKRAPLAAGGLAAGSQQ